MIEQRDALPSARVTYARWPRPSRTWTPGRREQRRWPAPPDDLSFQAPVSACRPERLHAAKKAAFIGWLVVGLALLTADSP